MEIVEGKCEGMCPTTELLWREKHGLLHRFEVLQDDNLAKRVDPDKAVKQYSRPAAGRNLLKPQELRPLPVLEKTVHYLIDSIMTKTDESWIDIYEFCCDRLRSVCQDLTIQRITGPGATWILQSAVQFYLYSDYRLFETSCVQRYDATINSTLMMECMKRALSSFPSGCHSHEDNDSHCQMAAIYILFNLDSHHSLLYALSLDKSLREHLVLSYAIQIGIAYQLKNYLFVLRSLSVLPPLLACCLQRHTQHLRKQLLLRLSHGFSSKACQFPLDVLASWLHMQNSRQATNLCSYYGLKADQDCVTFLKSSFQNSKPEPPRCHDTDLDQKLEDQGISRLIGGGT